MPPTECELDLTVLSFYKSNALNENIVPCMCSCHDLCFKTLLPTVLMSKRVPFRSPADGFKFLNSMAGLFTLSLNECGGKPGGSRLFKNATG